jgi:DNA repair exonuclease SbcCD ATPase subunit
MNLKWMRAKSFLSIGEKGVHVNFDQLGNIIVVKGKNLDVSPESSNGAGKSTLVEVLVYCLFGKLIKGLPHKEALNKRLKKGLEVEVCFELNGSEYRILRKRKPDKLELYKDGKEETLGSKTQQEIENTIKLNYESFINIVCFGEHNNHAFLAGDAASKRAIVENLLGLEKYLKYCKTAKDGLKEIETKLAVVKKKYETLCDQKDGCIKRLAQLAEKRQLWIDTKHKEIEQLNLAVVKKAEELNKTDDGQASVLYEAAQVRIKTNKDEMVKLEEQRTKISAMVDQIREKLELYQDAKNTSSLALKSKESDVLGKQKEIALIQNQIQALNKLQPGVKCSACFGTVDPNNYKHLIEHNTKLIKALQDDISVLLKERAESNSSLTKVVNEMNKILSLKKEVDEKSSAISSKLNAVLSAIQKDSQVKEPQIGSKELILKEQLNELTNRIQSKKEELDKHDPYVEIIGQITKEKSQLESDIGELRAQIDDGEALVPYYEFWIHGFGDDGIRAFIIDEVLPILNARINYWLQFLIDNKITLNFNNKFEVTIERNPPDGDPFVYNATSGGERRRINLAISQAFAHVMVISAGGACPSVISLDEVALNVDSHGVHGIYNMICELSKDRKVLVTTHDPNLNDLLGSCDVLTVVKKDGFSTIE